jgi:polo-like kinase 1
MVVSRDGDVMQYWESPDATEMRICGSNEEAELKKKMILMQHFRGELVKRAGGVGTDSDNREVRQQPLKHVKYWARTDKGMLFRMADRDGQANFRDHTKIIMERSTQRIFFVDGATVQVVTVEQIKQRTSHPAILERLADIKEMARHLI